MPEPFTISWRVSNSQGITAARPFEVGDLPEIVEQEMASDPIPVRVELPDGAEIEGTATALDADGRLVVRLADGRDEIVAAGDVTHARMVPPGPVA